MPVDLIRCLVRGWTADYFCHNMTPLKLHDIDDLRNEVKCPANSFPMS